MTNDVPGGVATSLLSVKRFLGSSIDLAQVRCCMVAGRGRTRVYL